MRICKKPRKKLIRINRKNKKIKIPFKFTQNKIFDFNLKDKHTKLHDAKLN